MDIIIQKMEFKGRKPQELAQLLREFKFTASETMAEIMLDRKYFTFIQKEREPRLLYEIESLLKQKDDLMMNMAFKSGDHSL